MKHGWWSVVWRSTKYFNIFELKVNHKKYGTNMRQIA